MSYDVEYIDYRSTIELLVTKNNFCVNNKQNSLIIRLLHNVIHSKHILIEFSSGEIFSIFNKSCFSLGLSLKDIVLHTATMYVKLKY